MQQAQQLRSVRHRQQGVVGLVQLVLVEHIDLILSAESCSCCCSWSTRAAGAPLQVVRGVVVMGGVGGVMTGRRGLVLQQGDLQRQEVVDGDVH